jgi:hypothetical protein
MPMSVHTCTRCPLRFATRAELADHLSLDHHLTAESLRGLTYPGASEAAPLYRAMALDDDVHTVLLIANQTLGSAAVAEALRDRRTAHDRLAVYVLVPATPSTHLATAPGGGRPVAPGEGDRTDDVGLAQARWRLRTALQSLRELGITAHGSVGDPNPLTAAADVIAVEPIDEIIVSTLDPRMSRWLRLDLPAALHRRFGLPVDTVTVHAVPAT